MARRPGEKRLDDTLKALIEKYGAEVALRGDQIRPVERLSSGISVVDTMLGGGWPKGRLSEVWGPESSGKTTLCLYTIAATQAAYAREKMPPVIYFDLENTFDPSWAVVCGVDLERILVIKAVAAEDVGELLTAYVKSQYPLVVIDSIVEMLPEKVLKKAVGEATYAPVASVLSALLPKIVVLQSQSPTTILLTNQVRDKVGFLFGEGQKAPGGHALFHLDSVRVRIQVKSLLREEGESSEPYGKELAMIVKKTKVGIEGKECRVRLLFGKGLEWDG